MATNYSNSGVYFERYVMSILPKYGFDTITGTKASGDFGLDIIAYKGGKKYGFQCKSYSGAVGVSAVQEAIAGQKYYNCDIAAVITNSFFTESAIKLANATGVILYDETFFYNLPKGAFQAAKKNINIEEYLQNNQSKSLLLGMDVQQNPIKLQAEDNVLISGATQTGKTYLVKSFLYQMSPYSMRVMLMDTSLLGYMSFVNCPALLIPICTDERKELAVLRWLASEIQKRLTLFNQTGSKNLKIYNSLVEEKQRLPRIYYVIDDITIFLQKAGREGMDLLTSVLLQGHIVGVLCIAVTSFVGKGFDKVLPYFTNRVLFNGFNRNLLDMNTVAKLERMDFIYKPTTGTMQIGRTFYISDSLSDLLSKKYYETYKYIELPTANDKSCNSKRGEVFCEDKQEDELLEEAIRVVLEVGQASAPILINRLRVGYARGLDF